jgi:mono/diheme cytochrome c family protein
MADCFYFKAVKPRKIPQSIIAAILLTGCAAPDTGDFSGEPPPLADGDRPAAVRRGESVYRKACLPCHGARGDGDGPQARDLDPRPRDLTRGVYKCRSTLTGVLPLDRDLYQTIAWGIPGTTMTPFEGLLSPQAIRDAVEHTKSLSPRFEEETIEPEDIVTVPGEPSATPASIVQGGEVYRENKCGDCHGERGRGDGPSAPTLKDSWGRKSVAFDFTTGLYRCGSSSPDVYRTFYTGMDGTPMPSYAGTVRPEDRWPLVHFVKSLHRPPTLLERVLLEVPE